MAVTATNSAIIRKTADLAFRTGLRTQPGGIDMLQFATTVNTSGINLEAGWFGGIGPVIEYTGEAQFQDMAAFTDTITPKEWQLGIEFDANTFDDDATGTAASFGASLALKCRDHVNKRLSQFLEAGVGSTLDTAYDGQFFFDDDHHGVTDAAHDNDLTGAAATGTDPTAPEVETAAVDMLEAARGFVDDKSEPYPQDISRFTFVGPTEYTGVASVVFGANGSLGNPANVVFNQESGVTGKVKRFAYLDNPHLADADKFYALARPGNGTVGPFVVNMRKGWEFHYWDPTNSEYCALNRKVRAYAYARYEVGYGWWQDGVSYTFS